LLSESGLILIFNMHFFNNTGNYLKMGEIEVTL